MNAGALGYSISAQVGAGGSQVIALSHGTLDTALQIAAVQTVASLVGLTIKRPGAQEVFSFQLDHTGLAADAFALKKADAADDFRMDLLDAQGNLLATSTNLDASTLSVSLQGQMAG